MIAYILSHCARIAENLALGGGVAMGAFCVFGISRAVCKVAAAKKIASYDEKAKRNLSMEEWSAKRDELAEKLFLEGERRVKVSPELDAPQFCRDWIAVDPGQIRQPVIMVRGPKVDKNGAAVKRNGAVVETWLEYAAECVRLNIKAAV